MNLALSVWGKNGSGKSTTAVNLACAYAKRGIETALVGANRFYGSIQHFLNMEIKPEQSLRTVLSGGDSLSIKEFFLECPSVKNLRVASLADADDCAGYGKLRTDTVERFISLVKNCYTVVVFDCDDSIEDPFSMYCLVMSEKIIYVTRPALQSVVFAKAYEPIVSGLQITDKLITVLIGDDGALGYGPDGAGAYAPFTAGRYGSYVQFTAGRYGSYFPYKAGGKYLTLPYCKEIARARGASSPVVLSHGVDRNTARYRKSVYTLADMLLPEKPGSE